MIASDLLTYWQRTFGYGTRLRVTDLEFHARGDPVLRAIIYAEVPGYVNRPDPKRLTAYLRNVRGFVCSNPNAETDVSLDRLGHYWYVSEVDR